MTGPGQGRIKCRQTIDDNLTAFTRKCFRQMLAFWVKKLTVVNFPHIRVCVEKEGIYINKLQPNVVNLSSACRQ